MTGSEGLANDEKSSGNPFAVRGGKAILFRKAAERFFDWRTSEPAALLSELISLGENRVKIERFLF